MDWNEEIQTEQRRFSSRETFLSDSEAPVCSSPLIPPPEDTPPSSERTTKMLSHKIYVVEPFFVFEPLTESASFSPTTKSFCKSFRSSLLVVHLRLNMLVDFGSGSSAASDGHCRFLALGNVPVWAELFLWLVWWSNVAQFLFSLLEFFFFFWEKLLLDFQSRLYMLSIVSIVRSCIDVACRVNKHFGVMREKNNKKALFHNFCVCYDSNGWKWIHSKYWLNQL